MSAIHDWQHDVIARQVRAQAYGDSTTRCRLCGLTLAQRRTIKPTETWDAGHPHPDARDVQPGFNHEGYAPEHAGCNRSLGARKGNQRRYSTNPTQPW